MSLCSKEPLTLLLCIEISNPKDRARAIYATVDKLPLTYHRALERIIFHLVRYLLLAILMNFYPHSYFKMALLM
jgi:hypothetical protein